jgi:hypothetical protein
MHARTELIEKQEASCVGLVRRAVRRDEYSSRRQAEDASAAAPARPSTSPPNQLARRSVFFATPQRVLVLHPCHKPTSSDH